MGRQATGNRLQALDLQDSKTAGLQVDERGEEIMRVKRIGNRKTNYRTIEHLNKRISKSEVIVTITTSRLQDCKTAGLQDCKTIIKKLGINRYNHLYLIPYFCDKF